MPIAKNLDDATIETQEAEQPPATEQPQEAPEQPPATKRAPAAEYSAQELAAASASVFGKKISPDCVIAAFCVAGITKATKNKAKEIVEKFMKREVK